MLNMYFTTLLTTLMGYLSSTTSVGAYEGEDLVLMKSAKSQLPYSMPDIPYYCPRRYIHTDDGISNNESVSSARMWGSMERTGLEICRFCPRIHCYIARGVNIYNRTKTAKFVTCSSLANMPRETDILEYLDCAMTGNSTDNINLFLYQRELVKRPHTAECIHTDFIKWIPSTFKIQNLQLGFPMEEIPKYIFLNNDKIFKDIENLMIQSSHLGGKVDPNYLTRPMFSTKTNLVFKSKLSPSLLTMNADNMKFCPLVDLKTSITKTCYLTHLKENSASQEEIQRIIFLKKVCPYEPRFAKADRLKRRVVREVPVYFTYIVTFSFIAMMIILIGFTIFVYYIKHFSGLSCFKKQVEDDPEAFVK